jgi:hypothetical protein
MPAQTKLSTDEKKKIKDANPKPLTIQAGTVARVYYAHPDPKSWSYTGLQGGLALVEDKPRGLFLFRLVDLKVNTVVELSPRLN